MFDWSKTGRDSVGNASELNTEVDIRLQNFLDQCEYSENIHISTHSFLAFTLSSLLSPSPVTLLIPEV